MTAREDEYFTDVEMLYCRDCQYADVSKFPNGLVMLSCSNDGSDHCGHFLTEEHLACDVELYAEHEDMKGRNES